MPEANTKRKAANDDITAATTTTSTTMMTKTMSTRTHSDSKLPKQKWNRSNSFNVTYIPLIERHNGALHSNEDCLNDRTSPCQNDSCNSSSSDNCSFCCCSSNNHSSCWHLKRRQIIRQSSHASAKNKLEYIESRTELTQHTTLTKKSISLPATPNLSQLRRPVGANYKKFSDEQAADINLHMSLTYEHFARRQQQHPQQQQQQHQQQQQFLLHEFKPHQQQAIQQHQQHASLSASLPNKENSMLLKYPGRYYDDPPQLSQTFGPTHNHHEERKSRNNGHNNNHNNNNNNATKCANVVVLAATSSAAASSSASSSLSAPASNQTKQPSKQTACCFHQAPTTNKFEAAGLLSTKHKTQNPPRPIVGGGGGFLRCEHCCESTEKNTGQNNGLKHTSSYLAMYQPSDTETVSDLSSYRFVTDEDLEIVHKNSNDKRQQIQSTPPPPPPTTTSSDLCVNYDDSVENDFAENLTNNHEYYTNNYNFNNNNNNKEKLTQNERERPIYGNGNSNSNEQHQHEQVQFSPTTSFANTNRGDHRVAETPTNCCYTIDKSHSDKLIYYQATAAVSEPLHIPKHDQTPNEDLFSSSLPRNYGSDFEPTTFARQLYIRQSLRSYKQGPTPPPAPPPKPCSEISEDPNYDPQKFYRKLQRFEKQNSVINQTLTRDALRSHQERSITPERCELLNCFPTYRSRSNFAKETQIVSQESQVSEHQNVAFQDNHLNLNSYANSPLQNNINYSCKIASGYATNPPKRTLRYDNHGRLKSTSISQLPVTSFYRRNSLETDGAQRALTHTPVKLTPTLTRKFTYTPQHAITAEITEVNEEELEANEKIQKNTENSTLVNVNGENLTKPTSEDQNNLVINSRLSVEQHNRDINIDLSAVTNQLVKSEVTLNQQAADLSAVNNQQVKSELTNHLNHQSLNQPTADLTKSFYQSNLSEESNQILQLEKCEILNQLCNNIINENHAENCNNQYKLSEVQPHNSTDTNHRTSDFSAATNQSILNYKYNHENFNCNKPPNGYQGFKNSEIKLAPLHVPTSSPLNSPTSPTPQLTSPSRLPPKKSQSSPLVLHHDTVPSSPVWLSSETIESQTSSSQKCLDETQSNCSDQTTIFHFEQDCSSSSSPSFSHSYGSPVQGYPAGSFLKGPLLVKRIPAIQSFGYIPTHSGSLGSANVRECIEKEITMEKRRNTLDRFQRLGFGRKSTPNTNVSSKNAASVDACGTSKQRQKPSEKTERLRELTELLRVGSGGQRSSPIPPPVPPPRKQRSATPSSPSTSFDKTDISEKSSPSTSLLLAENAANNNNNTTTSTASNNKRNTNSSGSNRCSDSSTNEPILSFMSTHSDDILLMDQDEPSNTSKSLRHLQKQISMEAAGVLEEKGIQQLKVNNAIDSTTAAAASVSASTTPLSSPTLKANASLSDFEVLLMKREKSKSPPTNNPFESAAEDENLLANSTQTAGEADKSEARTVIGSCSPKGIPFRSASFSQIDYSAGKYKKSALSALRDRLRREKAVDSTSPTNSLFNVVVDSLTWPRKKIEEKVEEVTAVKPTNKEPDWIYIPLKQKSELSINLCYGQDKSLEDVMESPEIIPEDEVFMADTIQELAEEKLEAHVSTIQAAHAKMESLTDTIHSDNDYVIDESQVPITVAANDLMEAKSDSAEESDESKLAKSSDGLDIFEPNLATLMEEQIPLESPPDNFLQTATTCLIPVSVYECAAQEWGLENPPQEWEEVAPEEFNVISEIIEPLVTLDQCIEIEKPETKTDKEQLPTISVRCSSDEMDDEAILRTKENTSDKADEETTVERRQASADEADMVKKRYSQDDMDIVNENRSSLENIPTRHSADERRKADMSIRRKGIYIENWQEPSDTTDGAASKALALDISIANLNAIKPDSPEDNMMYINSPATDDNKTPGSLYSFDLNTPESEYRHSPVWSKNPMMSSFSCQSSEEKDDIPLASPPVTLSTSHISLPRQNKSFPFLRNDSVSDNESDRTPPPSRDRSSPVSSDHDFKRFSKRPLRGPYGQMLEAEMKKPQKKHFEEILEELKESDGSLHARRQRSPNDDAGGRNTSNLLPHYSNSMRVRKTANSTYLPVPQHTRAASTPSQMENVSGNGGGYASRNGATDNDMCIIKPLEKKYQSTLDTTTIGRESDDTLAASQAAAKALLANTPAKTKTSLLQREQKRASSESPTKISHSKRSQSMSSSDKPAGHLQHVHQQKRSLDVTSSTSKQKSGATAPSSKAASTTSSPTSAVSGNTTNILPTPELLAQLLKGSSEKQLSEQRQQMYADTRTHIVQEIFRNEQSYVESLQTMVNRYLKVLKSPENANVIDSRTVDEIFFMVPDILEIHEKFLTELKHRLDNWDAQQKVGDAFMETFSKLEVLEVYTSFVNNCSRAKNAIRTTKHQRPSFAKFLETTAREHKGKLTLDYLLIKPVQKFPNYELLFQRLIKHTDHDHPDQKHLQDVLKQVHDILVHINCKEREILENGQREATLRELEGVIEGITDLTAPDRQFLLFDLVTMPSGQGARKERGFFLFNDLLVLTSIKKRSGTIRKPNTTTCPGTVASTLDTNKYKFLTKISLDCLEIVKTKDENIKRIMTEIENLAEDCNKLQQITEITASLKFPHQYLEDVIRELHRDAQRQLSERQTNDAQLNMLELAVNSPNGTQKLSIVFSKSEKRTQWEETFNEAKQKLAATMERQPIPEFLTSIPIRKTRAGLQFTCAAATLSDKRDVWVCNSDGYVGQVCIMSLHPEPNVTSCNGVCNARILCVASVPAYSPHSASVKSTSSNEDQSSSASSTSTAQHLLRSSLPPLSYTQQLLDYRKSISPNYSTPSSLIGTPEKKREKSQTSNSGTSGSTTSVQAAGNSSDIQLDLNLSSSDEEADAHAAASGNVSISSTGVGGGGVCERVPSPAPSTHTTGSTSTASTAIVGSNNTLYHGHQDSNPEESDGNQSTMWIGTEDGCIHVYNSTDNIRIKKNRIKIEHHSAVYSILYLDNRVFVALANGDICVYLRDGSVWNTTSSHCLSLGTVTSPVTKLLNVHGRLWCSLQGIIKVLDIETLAVINQIQISSDSKPITNMCVSGNFVWISIQNSAHIKCFHSNTHQLITEVNLAQAVNKMLSNCDEIIRQHKAACLRVTSLLSCRDLIWIGTSAGVLLTIPSQGYEKGAPSVVPTGIPHGHTGHVRFLTYVETTAAATANSGADGNKDHETTAGAKSPKPKGDSSTAPGPGAAGNILIISGGDGYEDFRNSGANNLSEIAGREDSTNHLLIWQI